MRCWSGCAALAMAMAAAEAVGYTYKDFYRVDEFEAPVVSGVAYCGNEYGDLTEISYKLVPGEDGSYGADLVKPVWFDAESAFWTAVKASVNAAEAMAEAKYAQAQTDAFAKRLSCLLMTDGFEIKDAAGGTARVRISAGSLGAALGASSGTSGPLDATIDAEFAAEPDGVSISKTRDGRLQVAGASAATSSTDEWWKGSGFFVPFLDGAGALGWKRYGGLCDGVFGTMTSDGRTMLTLAGWGDGSAECGTTMSKILTEKNVNNRADHYVLTRRGRGASAKFHYVPFGERLELGGGSPVDGTSITTNRDDGAVADGVASLYGWDGADSRSIPRKGDGRLEWTAPGGMVDGFSLALTDGANGGVWELKDAHLYAGQHARHYFGTSGDSSAALGWHELPNVTTNVVAGDEVTVSSTQGGASGEDVKTLGLKGWNYSYGGDPLFLANVGGALSYVPMATASNGVPCGCTNRWEALCEWVGDGARLEGDGALTLPKGAPDGWCDGKSVEVAAGGKLQVGGWASAAPCSASVSAMLEDPAGSDATTHLFLARKTDTGKLHYVPLGVGVSGGCAAIEVVGTNGGSAVCTNRLTFASDENSDVRFVVSDEGNGNVRITVGVYYK